MQEINLLQITDYWQKQWQKKSIAVAVPKKGAKKFFLIFAYPGISGFLHVGHMRGFTYTDVFARFKRMQGFNVLFPVGFHASGLPSVAYAKKVERKDETTLSQLKDYGLTEKQIKELETPENVVKFFSKVYVQDFFRKFGFLIDESRIINTISPEYSKFIEWQFKKLKEKNLLVQKEHFSPACPDEGPVAIDTSETDISKGGSAETLEYVIIKFKLNDLIIPCATLRPETSQGVTNIWMNPQNELVKVMFGKETWLLTKKAAEKLSFQKKNFKILTEKVFAKDFIGKKVLNPITNSQIPIISSSFVDEGIGTGIVMSVPAHAPWDFVALQNVKANSSDKEIQAIQLIPLINVKDFGQFPAKQICEQMNIVSLSQKQELEKATEELYKKEFHSGTLNQSYGKFSGTKVSEAKEILTKEFVSRNVADKMLGFSEQVICRCGKEIIIQLVPNQWFIKYSDKSLTQKTKQHAKTMKVFPEQYYNELPAILDWFDDRACVRKGRWLGTRLPFDKEWIIEPISDSTLYPLTYTYSHFINSKKLKPENLSEEFFDFIFLGKGTPAIVARKTKINLKLLKQIKQEVDYWYPLDLNLGGKEHKTVHFPVFLFNHVGILPQNKWPKNIFVNWWVTGKTGKISKSKGGAESIHNLSEQFSVDALRIFYCHVGNAFNDIEFDAEIAQKYKDTILRIFSQIDSLIALNGKANKELDEWLKHVVEKDLQEVQNSLNEFDVRTSIETLLFKISKNFSWYSRRQGANKKLLQELLIEWIKQLTPFIPHACEEIWSKQLKQKSLVSLAQLKQFKVKQNSSIEKSEELIKQAIDDVNYIKDLIKKEKLSKITFIVPEQWKWKVLLQLKKLREANEKLSMGEAMKELLKDSILAKNPQNLSFFLQGAMKKINELQNFSQIDEFIVLSNAKSFLEKEFNAKILIEKAENSSNPKAKNAFPLKPAILVE